MPEPFTHKTMNARLLSDQILEFHEQLKPAFRLPRGVELLHPYCQDSVRSLVRLFYQTYYADHEPRVWMLGINPGRHGAGVTGIPFTDTHRLEQHCGLRHGLGPGRELSSEFIYRVVEAAGGAGRFYGRVYISSVCPLGFTKGGKNLNYYDDPLLLRRLEPFIRSSLEKEWTLLGRPRRCLCLGEGKNYRYLSELNRETGWFEQIQPLAHPRWIMQYARNRADSYVGLYLRHLEGQTGWISG